jgi:hypothetical protein
VAAPWLRAAFKAIPWKEVVAAAPSIVEGTRKLWGSVTKTEKQPSPAGERSGTSSSGRSDPISALEDRVVALEAKTAEMAHEAVTSAELIKSLAEQNAKLVQAVEILRLRMRRRAWFTVALGIAMVLMLFWASLHK